MHKVVEHVIILFLKIFALAIPIFIFLAILTLYLDFFRTYSPLFTMFMAIATLVMAVFTHESVSESRKLRLSEYIPGALGILKMIHKELSATVKKPCYPSTISFERYFIEDRHDPRRLGRSSIVNALVRYKLASKLILTRKRGLFLHTLLDAIKCYNNLAQKVIDLREKLIKRVATHAKFVNAIWHDLCRTWREIIKREELEIEDLDKHMLSYRRHVLETLAKCIVCCANSLHEINVCGDTEDKVALEFYLRNKQSLEELLNRLDPRLWNEIKEFRRLKERVRELAGTLEKEVNKVIEKICDEFLS